MQKYITILLLLTCSLCYGQGKYTVRKAYQYEGNDSTNAKWVLTEKFNKKGKLVYARYNEYPLNEEYIGDGKNYYTYNDTLLTKMLVTRKAKKYDAFERMIKQDTYVNGDSVEFLYNYKFDDSGRLVRKRKIRRERIVEFAICGLGAEIIRENIKDSALIKADTAIYNKMQRNADTLNVLLQKIPWGKPDTTIHGWIYDGSRLRKEEFYENGNLHFDKTITYEYDCDEKPYLKNVYSSLNTHELYFRGFYIYKYYIDSYTEYYIDKHDLYKKSDFNDSSIVVKPIYKTTYFDEKNRIVHTEEKPKYNSAVERTYYYYDKYNRVIKDVYSDGETTLTRLYTYE